MPPFEKNDAVTKEDQAAAEKFLDVIRQVPISVENSRQPSGKELPTLPSLELSNPDAASTGSSNDSSKVAMAAAKTIRQATKRDNFIDTGTDENAIHTALKSLNQGQRALLCDYYKKTYGIELKAELKGEMSGVDLDKGLNLLTRRDNKPDDAGFIHEQMQELSQWYGRSTGSLERALRMKLSSMSSDDITQTSSDYQSKYETPLASAFANHPGIDADNKKALSIWMHGSDRLSEFDVDTLTSIALKRGDIEMFQEVMNVASPKHREKYSDNKGWRLLDESFSGLTLDRAVDYAKFGKLTAAMQILSNESMIGDNESAIEQALFNMGSDERTLFAQGRNLSNSNREPADKDEEKALNYYDGLCKAIVKAGNRLETLKWQDMALFQGGTLISRIAEHKHMLKSDRAEVLPLVENLMPRDWLQMKSDPVYRQQVEEMLGLVLNNKDFADCSELLTGKLAAAAPGESMEAGRRGTLDLLNEAAHWNGTDHKAVIHAIESMSPGEQTKYRSDGEYRTSIDQKLDKLLDKDDPWAITARVMLDDVMVGRPPQDNILAKLNEYATHWTVDEGKVVREVEQAFKAEPELRSRIVEPKSDGEKIIAECFKEALRKAFWNADSASLSSELLLKGHLSPELRARLGKSEVLEGLTQLSTDERSLLLSQDANNKEATTLQAKVFGRFSEDARTLAAKIIEQGAIGPEDHLRAFVLKLEKKDVLQLSTLLKAMSTAEGIELASRYSTKYGGNLQVHLRDRMSARDFNQIESLFKHAADTPQDILSNNIEKHSAMRDGARQFMVDNLWDGTGFQADEAVLAYVKAMSDSGAGVEALSEERQKAIIDRTATALLAFDQSTKQLSETAANAAITAAALGAAPFTGGTSLTLLAKIAIAASAGVAIKMSTKLAIEGDQYEWSKRQVALDVGTGMVYGAFAVVGPAEIGKLMGVGGQAGTRAAAIATGSLKQISEQIGVDFLVAGGDEVLEQGVTQIIRTALINGGEVSTKAIEALARQVATAGNEGAVKLSLHMAVGAAAKEQSARLIANIGIQYGLPAASGFIAGGTTGAITGAAEWDNNKPVADNVKLILASSATNAAMGAASAAIFTAVMKSVGAAYRGTRRELAENHLVLHDLADADQYLVRNVDQVDTFVNKILKAGPAGEGTPVSIYGASFKTKPGDWFMRTGPYSSALDSPVFIPAHQMNQSLEDFLALKTGLVMALPMDRTISLTQNGKVTFGYAGDWMVLDPVTGQKAIVARELFNSIFDPHQMGSLQTGATYNGKLQSALRVIPDDFRDTGTPLLESQAQRAAMPERLLHGKRLPDFIVEPPKPRPVLSLAPLEPKAAELVKLADIHHAADDFLKAEQSLKQAIALQKAAHGPFDSKIGGLLDKLEELYTGFQHEAERKKVEEMIAVHLLGALREENVLAVTGKKLQELTSDDLQYLYGTQNPQYHPETWKHQGGAISVLENWLKESPNNYDRPEWNSFKQWLAWHRSKMVNTAGPGEVSTTTLSTPQPNLYQSTGIPSILDARLDELTSGVTPIRDTHVAYVRAGQIARNVIGAGRQGWDIAMFDATDEAWAKFAKGEIDLKQAVLKSASPLPVPNWQGLDALDYPVEEAYWNKHGLTDYQAIKQHVIEHFGVPDQYAPEYKPLLAKRIFEETLELPPNFTDDQLKQVVQEKIVPYLLKDLGLPAGASEGQIRDAVKSILAKPESQQRTPNWLSMRSEPVDDPTPRLLRTPPTDANRWVKGLQDASRP